MVVECDFSDVDAFFRKGKHEVHQMVDSIGEESEQYARDHGSYQDRTGYLRSRNGHNVDENETLELTNDAEYASYVESKGFDVLSGAALPAQKRLKEVFEQ